MPLVGKIIGCCALSAASILSIINFKAPEVPKESGVESIHTEVAELDAEASSVSHEVEEKEEEVKEKKVKEESAQGSVEVVTTTKTNTQPKISTATKAQATAKSTAQTKTNQATTQTTQKRYTSVYDFEHAMLGVCPQNVPSGVWPDKLRPIVSLGYRPEERYSSTDIELHIATYWSSYKQGIQGATITFTGGFFGGDCSSGSKDVTFTFSFINNTVTYKAGSFITPNGEQWAKTIAQRGQNYLQSISSQFKAKCGY